MWYGEGCCLCQTVIHCRAAPCHCQGGHRLQAEKCLLNGGRTVGLGACWVLSGWVLWVPTPEHRGAASRVTYNDPFTPHFSQNPCCSEMLPGGQGCHPHQGATLRIPPKAPQAGMETIPQRPLNMGCSQICRSSSAFKTKITAQSETEFSFLCLKPTLH